MSNPKPIYRYVVQRKSDKKFYKNPTIYETLESFWDSDISEARFCSKDITKEWNKKMFKILTFELVLQK